MFSKYKQYSSARLRRYHGKLWVYYAKDMNEMFNKINSA